MRNMVMIKRFLFVFALIVCICCLIGCQTDPQYDPTQTTDTSAVIDTSATDLVLVVGGEAKLTLIRSEDAPSEVTSEVTRLHRKISEVTGVSLEYATDIIPRNKTRTPEEDAFPAILVGQTNYSASSAALAELSYGEGKAFVSGNQLVVAAVDKSAVKSLIDALCAYIEENGKEGELIIPADFAVISQGSKLLQSVPVVEGGIYSRYTDAGDNAYKMEILQVNDEEYSAYCTRLAESGQTLYSSNEIGENRFMTYTTDTTIYNYLYTPSDDTLRVLIDKRSNTALPPIDEPTYTKVCDSSLTQLGIEYNYDNPSTPYQFTESIWQNGMGYIFRLEDGSFIIIDGGFYKDRNAKIIWDKLNELSADYKPEKITIAAWFLTHSHGDHLGAFKAFMAAYSEKIQLNYLIYNSGSKAQYASFDATQTYKLYDLATYYVEKENIIIARPGQTMQFANADIEILFSSEFLGDSVLTANALSIHFRITIAGQSFLFSADSHKTSTNEVVRLYGNALASDFVQVIHHGASGGTSAYYACVDPTIVLWPLGEYDYFVDPDNPNKTTRSTDSTNAFIFTSQKICEVILAGHTDRTISLPYTFPTERIDPIPSN